MEQTYTESNALNPSTRIPAANVGSTERLLTIAAGAALLGYAWRNGSKALGAASAGMLLRGATGYCPGYAALGVDHTDAREALSGSQGVHIRESIVIEAPAEKIYRFWRQLDRLPFVMPHLDRVEELDAKRSRWTAKAFNQLPVTWDAEIINEVPFETIAWQTLPGQAIQTAGSVTFKPISGTRSTDVRVNLQYAAPGGKAANWLAEMAGQDPARYTRDALRALKHRLEADASSAPAITTVREGDQ
ncbi:MAG TPA: SRPBCC family protein [Vicinamibacterales bacterium]|jgi:uncharacterized membrane protein